VQLALRISYYLYLLARFFDCFWKDAMKCVTSQSQGWVFCFFNKLMGIGNTRRRERSFPKSACDGGSGWTEILNRRVQDRRVHRRYTRARCAQPTYACIRYFVGPLYACILIDFASGTSSYTRDDATGSSLCARLINIIISRCGGDIIRLRVNSCCAAIDSLDDATAKTHVVSYRTGHLVFKNSWRINIAM